MKEEHIKNSTAGQVTPGRDDLHYLCYYLVATHDKKLKLDQILTFEQWQAQNHMLHCQILGEG